MLNKILGFSRARSVSRLNRRFVQAGFVGLKMLEVTPIALMSALSRQCHAALPNTGATL
jgi:hypothetical protein